MEEQTPSCMLTEVTPLVKLLFHIVQQNIPIKDSSSNDIEYLFRAMARFNGASADALVSFENDSPEIQRALSRNVAGVYTRSIGKEWHPGEPMHISQFIGGFYHAISRASWESLNEKK